MSTDVVGFFLAGLVLVFGVLWRQSEQRRVIDGDALRQRGAKLDELEAKLVQQERKANEAMRGLRAQLRSEARGTDEHTVLAEQNVQLEEDVRTMREALLLSEGRRREMGEVLELVFKEKRVWYDLYSSLRITAGNAQAILSDEIARLAQLANAAVHPTVKTAIAHADQVFTQAIPARPSDDDFRAKMARANGEGAASAAAPPATPTEPPPEAAQ